MDPILPGKNGDWKQHPLITSILAAFEGCIGGTHRLENWVGNTSDRIDRRGRPRTQRADQAQARNGGSEPDSGGGAPPPRGRPLRPEIHMDIY